MGALGVGSISRIACVRVREQLPFSPLLLLCGSQRLNSGHQAWWRVPLVAESSFFGLIFSLLIIKFLLWSLTNILVSWGGYRRKENTVGFDSSVSKLSKWFLHLGIDSFPVTSCWVLYVTWGVGLFVGVSIPPSTPQPASPKEKSHRSL